MKTLHQYIGRVSTSLLFATVIACAASAQQQTVPTSDATPDSSITAVDPKAHEAATRFVKVAGLKEKMTAQIDTMLTQGAENMKSQFPNLRPEFAEEWKKRMKARLDIDDFIAVIAHVYEKYFTAEELDQLTDAVNQSKQGKTPALTDALKQKFQKNMVDIQSEIVGGTTQLGAKIGGEVGQEIAKEHPDWAPDSALKPGK